MKLTGGQAGGLRIDTPPGKRTRPSTDRLRESLFAILAPRLPGARVLDLCAGSGSLGLEAASRGAVRVDFVERHGPTVRILTSNTRRLEPAGVTCDMQVHCKDVMSWISAPAREPFDLILVDPPYADLDRPQWLDQLLGRLAEGEWLAPGGVLTLETDVRSPLPEQSGGWKQVRRKVYGTSAVTFWNQVP